MAKQSGAARRENARPYAASRGWGPGGSSPGSDVGGGAGDHDARRRGCAPSRPGWRFIQKARSLRGRRCARGAGPGLPVFRGVELLELLRGGQVRRARGASARGLLPAAGARVVRTRVSEEVGRGGGCRSPGSAHPPPPRPVPASSAHRSLPLSEPPAPGAARPLAATPGPAVRGGQAAAGLAV